MKKKTQAESKTKEIKEIKKGAKKAAKSSAAKPSKKKKVKEELDDMDDFDEAEFEEDDSEGDDYCNDAPAASDDDAITEKRLAEEDKLMDDILDAIDDEALKEAEEHGEHITSPHTKQEWTLLFNDYHQTKDIAKSNAARDEIVASLQGLIHFVLNRYYKTYTAHWDDLQSAGNLGLMKGIKQYKPNYKGQFYLPSTLVTREIRHECREYVDTMVLNTKTRTKTIEDKIRKIIERKTRDGEDIDIDDIMNEANIPIRTAKNVMAIIQTRNSIVSLDEVIQDSETTYQNLLPSNVDTPEQAWLKKERSENIMKIMNETLTKEQLIVCDLHYGLSDEIHRTNAEIAKITGIPENKIAPMINDAEMRLGRVMQRHAMFNDEKRHRTKMRIHRYEDSTTTTEELARELASLDWDSLGDL